MKKYFVLYKAPTEKFQKLMASSTPEAQKKSMDEWRGWMEKHKTSLADGGAPVGKTKQVSKSGIADSRNDIGGYSIVQADSQDAAAKLFADNPHLQIPKATIEVSEIMEMPGV